MKINKDIYTKGPMQVILETKKEREERNSQIMME